VFTKRERFVSEREKEAGSLLPERMRSSADRLKDSITRTVTRVRLEGVDSSTKLVGEDRLPGNVNYFIGSNPKKWHTDVPTDRKVPLQNAWRRIRLDFYRNSAGR